MNDFGLIIIVIALAYGFFQVGGAIVQWVESWKESRLP